MRTTILATSALLLALPAIADETAQLSIEGGAPLVTRAAAPAHLDALDEIRSGWTYRSAETQSLQMDDFENPAMLTVDRGLELWGTVEAGADESCASCHGDIEDMAGLRTQLPKVTEDGELWAMTDFVNDCRETRMDVEPWKWESSEMLAMTSAIGHQSRGMPVDVAIDGDAAPFWEQGKELYYQRVGQLDMACASCHEDYAGEMIRADHLSQGQINGFPTYRLKWGGVGSTHRRFKGCMDNIRATPYKRGSDEFTALELYLASRGNGLSVETPAVRN